MILAFLLRVFGTLDVRVKLAVRKGRFRPFSCNCRHFFCDKNRCDWCRHISVKKLICCVEFSQSLSGAVVKKNYTCQAELYSVNKSPHQAPMPTHNIVVQNYNFYKPTKIGKLFRKRASKIPNVWPTLVWGDIYTYKFYKVEDNICLLGNGYGWDRLKQRPSSLII